MINYTERLTLLERDLAQENHLQLLLAIDPTSPASISFSRAYWRIVSSIR